MANQIVVSAGAKVRNLQDVIIGTSGVLTSLGFDVANGVPRLDVNGKILVSQLPNSVMEYKGTWSAATNTPTLVNGTGNQGDVYLCNVAGTVNFGAGAIAFVVGDQVIYSGSIWQRASGATGTVTSVAITETGDSLNITGSPITTSGTINIGFNGTNLQYVNGAGNLTTFPTLITSIGLSMPSAFSVANSPLTANGTIAVTGAGVASQYIRGNGTLADFPSSGGGGSSVSYYLNGGTSQGTIGGTTYYEMSKTADTGTGVDFPKTGDGFIVAFLTDANDPAQLNIPAGNWNYEIYAQMSSNGGTPQMYAELYKYDGTTFTLISTSPNEILYDGTALNLYTFAMAVPATSLTLTDRLAVKLYATNSGGKTTTIHTQNGHLCQIITTFSTGITALNGLTAQVQYFQTGTSGTDFNISSTTATHTFNIPDASATARGLITTGTQTIAGAKTFSANPSINVAGQASLSILSSTGNSALIFGYVNNVLKGTIDINATEFKFASTINSTYKFQASGLGIASLIFNNTTNYSYTFPDATGTMAMLEGTQTFTGGKTFDAAYFNGAEFINTAYFDKGLWLVKNGIPIVFTPLQTTIYSEATSNNVIFRDNLSKAKLIFDNSTQTYTFPAATGTLALTSDLGSYLPLTGGTLTGALGGTSATFSSSITASDFISTSNVTGAALRLLGGGTSVIYQKWSNGGGNYYIGISNSGGGGLLGSQNNYSFCLVTESARDMSFGTNGLSRMTIFAGGSVGINTGSNDAGYQLDVNGTGRFSGNMVLGTTALSGGGAAQWLTANGTPYGGGFISSVGGVAKAYYYYDNAANAAVIQGIAGVGVQLLANNVAALTISTAGAATFSSSVTALDIYAKQSTGGYISLRNGGAGASGYVEFISNNGTTRLGYLGYSTTNVEMTLENSAKFIVTGGNVGIGTVAPVALLNIYGSTHIQLQNATTGAASSDGTRIQLSGNDLQIINRETADTILYTSDTERARITSAGNVGIGTNSPDWLFKIEKNTASGGGGQYPAMVINNTNAAGYMAYYFFSGATNKGGLEFSNGTNELLISSVGTVKISTLGTGAVTATSGVLSTTSDMNLKIEDGYIDTALDKILKLKPRYFYWKEESGLPTDLRQLGFYAQEVNEVLGEEVANTPKTENDKWGIYDRGIIAMLTKAIQELKAEIDQLKNK
jgi:hypothetical protein